MQPFTRCWRRLQSLDTSRLLLVWVAFASLPSSSSAAPAALSNSWELIVDGQFIDTVANISSQRQPYHRAPHFFPSPPLSTTHLAQDFIPTGPLELSLYQVERSAKQTLVPRSTVRTDVFRSLRAGSTKGEILTRPLVFAGGELLLSFSASEQGGIRVEILDKDHRPLPGYRLPDCEKLHGNKVSQTVRWAGSPDIKSLRGKTVRFRFVLTNADLYAFRVRDPAWRRSFPTFVRDAAFRSSIDQTLQPTLYYHPGGSQPVPLLVALHTWSSDYYNDHHQGLARWCEENRWAFLHPNFRGPNRNPSACGSELAVSDIKDAVAWARTHSQIDGSRIFLTGTSGGGHMSLLMAGRAPELWAGVSAWVGISDLEAWHRECRDSGRHYAADIAKCCGGEPGSSEAADAEYKARSPLTHLHRAARAGLAVDINAGIRDGHEGSVPISHSLHAFNHLAAPADRIPKEAIAFMTREAAVMPGLESEALPDPGYGEKQPLFRRTSGPARITLFDGGHEMIEEAALGWIMQQAK